jgi:hypothetical protein
MLSGKSPFAFHTAVREPMQPCSSSGSHDHDGNQEASDNNKNSPVAQCGIVVELASTKRWLV